MTTKAFLAIRTAANSTAETATLLHELAAAMGDPALSRAATKYEGSAASAVRAVVLAQIDDESRQERDERLSREMLAEYDALVSSGLDKRKAPGIVARRRSTDPIERQNIMRRIRDHRAKRKTDPSVSIHKSMATLTHDQKDRDRKSNIRRD